MTKQEQYLVRLADDIRMGQALAKEAAEESNDGGTCNFDGVYIRIPRIAVTVIQAVMEAQGFHIGSRWNHSLYGRGYMISPDVRGQAERRERGAKALYLHLKECGHDVSHYQQMD